MNNALQFVRKMMLVGNGLAFLGFAIWNTGEDRKSVV